MSFYKADPNNPSKQIPVVNNRRLITTAETPAEHIISKRANEVIINNSGSYAFLYNNTSQSIGDTCTDAHGQTQYTTGSVYNVTAGAGGPISLPIQPIAWRRTVGTAKTGDVTFIYRNIKKGELG